MGDISLAGYSFTYLWLVKLDSPAHELSHYIKLLTSVVCIYTT